MSVIAPCLPLSLSFLYFANYFICLKEFVTAFSAIFYMKIVEEHFCVCVGKVVNYNIKGLVLINRLWKYIHIKLVKYIRICGTMGVIYTVV